MMSMSKTVASGTTQERSWMLDRPEDVWSFIEFVLEIDARALMLFRMELIDDTSQLDSGAKLL